MTVIEDPWQARMDRLRRFLPLPLLVLATVVAILVPSDAASPIGPAGLVVAGLAAVWAAAVTSRMPADASPVRRRTGFAVHSVLAGYLVTVDPWYGIFAYVGFLLAYPLGPRWRTAGFTLTALIVSGSMAGGYPWQPSGGLLPYVVVAVVILALVLNSASITNRAVEQNRERGVIIAELAEANRRLEASMAENAALHEQLVARAREAGVVEERQRLAGEIHDTLAQGLTGIVAQLEATEHARQRPEEWTRHLAQAKALARSSLTEARRSVRALRPEQLDRASLPEAIGDHARTWSQCERLPAELETVGTPARIGPEIEDAVFRVAQEALANAGKHARASKVQLTLSYLEDTLLLDVADDGAGFDPAASTDGYGLVGMRRRLAKVGGTLTVESVPGYGTTVNASVPL